MPDLATQSAARMAILVRQKKVSPVELVEAHLRRIESLEPRLRAFAFLDPEGARRQARAAERALRKTDDLGPLHGVPLTIKSSIDVAGWPCDAGSRLRADYIAPADAPLVARLRVAGAILLGNTNTPEFLMAYETDNLLRGRTCNPWDLDRTAGGSSGGEAASIAACCSAAGVGSDGGGSIRVPAHFSGICGLKPTPGRIPATGHFPPSLGPFARLGVVGPMARTVTDLRLLFEIMAGPDCGDPTGVHLPLPRVSDAEAKRLRVGYFEDDGRVPVTPETRAAVQAAAESLRRQGFDVLPFRPAGLDRAREFWWSLFGLAAAEVLKPMLAGHEPETSPILQEFAALVAADAPLTLDRLLHTWLERDQLRIEFERQMQEFPVLLCPTCSIPAFRHGERSWQVEGKTVEYVRGLDVMSYTQWFNLLTNPGVVVPVGRSPEGLPIGVQVVTRPYQEQLALTVAGCIERDFGYQEPPLSREAAQAVSGGRP